MKTFLFFLFLCACPLLPLCAQESSDIEKLLESNDILHSEEGYEEMTRTLLHLQRYPLNINTAGFDSLKMLFFLSDSQIDRILSFRKKYGIFLSRHELLLVGGIGKKDLENISPFICLGEVTGRKRLQAIRKYTSQEILAKARSTLPRQEGYKSYSPSAFKSEAQYLKKQASRFQGIPLGTLLKYKIKTGDHWQAGLTLENDPGEAYFTRYQKMGFDFFSAHLCATTTHFFRKIILGDYRTQWGQGLVAWGGFSSGKSSLALGNEKSGKGFSPHTSTDENNFLRGVALSLQPLPSLQTDLFFSSKKTDGNRINPASIDEENILTATLYESGNHRNSTENEKKHQLKEWTTGLSFHWNASAFRIGINTVYYNFQPPIKKGEKIYQQFNDEGKKRLLTSIDYKTSFRNIYLFGETATCEQHSWATVNGLRFSLYANAAMSVIYRRYDKNYVSRYAHGFGEYSNTSNEEGLYIGLDISPVKNLKINTYYDWFRYFSPRYNAYVPDAGQEFLFEANYTFSDFEHLFRFKNERKPENFNHTDHTYTVLRVKNEIRYQLSYRPLKKLELRTRIDFTFYRKLHLREKGYLIHQDLIYTSGKEKFNFQFRLAYFDTDSYNTRIYSYENNVLYGYSFPAYFERGFRTYLNLNWKLHRILTFYLKTGFTYYPDADHIGSSVTRVEGNKLFDLTAQLRIHL